MAVVQTVEVTEIARRRAAGDKSFVLLDVREADELQVAQVAGALHIPMGEVPQRAKELDPDKEIVVMCHRGRRSNLVAHFLVEQGFTNVHNLKGGIHAWSLEVDPSVPVY